MDHVSLLIVDVNYLTWSGQSGFHYTKSATENCMRRLGVNWLAYKDALFPELSAVLYKNNTPDVKVTLGLLVWREHVTTDWLIFDVDGPDLFGKVYATDVMEGEPPAVIPHAEPSDAGSDDDSDIYINRPYADWISYMECYWDIIANDIEIPEAPLPTEDPFSDEPVSVPAEIEFERAHDSTGLTFPWSQRSTVSKLALTQ